MGIRKSNPHKKNILYTPQLQGLRAANSLNIKNLEEQK